MIFMMMKIGTITMEIVPSQPTAKVVPVFFQKCE